MKTCVDFKDHLFTVSLTLPNVVLSRVFGECGDLNYHFKALLFLIAGEIVPISYTLKE